MSSFTVKTETFQNMLNKVSKCASRSKFSVLTNLVNVVLKNNKLSLTTTDTNNYLTVSETVTGEDTSFTVNVETFTKLISKISTDSITIELTNDTIIVKGNGTYKLPIQLDVDETPIKYPVKTINNPEKQGVIKTSVIKNIILNNKSSVAITMENPYLTGYLCTEDSVISADAFNVCVYNIDTFGTTLLISPVVFDLLSMASEEEITYKISDSFIMFETNNLTLFSSLMEGADKYPLETVQELMATEYPSKCVLPKTELLNIIDRLSLFINDNDQNGVYLTFTKSGLKVESTRGDGIENVPYQGSENFVDYTCFANVDSLKRQISCKLGECINLCYGDPDTLMIVQDNVKQLSSLMTDDRE